MMLFFRKSCSSLSQRDGHILDRRSTGLQMDFNLSERNVENKNQEHAIQECWSPDLDQILRMGKREIPRHDISEGHSNNFVSNHKCCFPDIKTVEEEQHCSILCISKSGDGDSEAPRPEGDTRSQELLARIAMLQTQKVRLTDYLDERSSYLTQFAEEANAEMDKIGEDAIKELDQAESRIMNNLESSMQGFEELAELNRQEIEMQDKKLEEFEDEIDDNRNEGMFFKSFGQSKPLVDKAKAKEEAEKIKNVTKASAGSKTRRNVYLALMGLVVVGIADAVITSSLDGKKIAALGLILVGVLSQYIYEQSLISETEENRKKTNDK